MSRTAILTPLLLMLVSCLPYKMSTLSFLEQQEQYCSRVPLSDDERTLASHWLYTIIPRHRALIRWYDLPHWCSWALIGNDDDGLFGEGPCANYNTEHCDGKRALLWGLRNPFHNLSFYVLGTAGCRNSQLTLLSATPCRIRMLHYQREADTVFADNRTSLYIALHGWKPFISLRLHYLPCRRADFYLGWRERGNLGAKLQPFKQDK